MNRSLDCAALVTSMTALGLESSTTTIPDGKTSAVTFNKDVLPVLEENCQSCHHAGGIAPMPFVTYVSTKGVAPLNTDFVQFCIVNRR